MYFHCKITLCIYCTWPRINSSYKLFIYSFKIQSLHHDNKIITCFFLFKYHMWYSIRVGSCKHDFYSNGSVKLAAQLFHCLFFHRPVQVLKNSLAENQLNPPRNLRWQTPWKYQENTSSFYIIVSVMYPTKAKQMFEYNYFLTLRHISISLANVLLSVNEYSRWSLIYKFILSLLYDSF